MGEATSKSKLGFRGEAPSVSKLTGARRVRMDEVRARTGRPMTWVSLHHHSTFSYLDGFGMPENHLQVIAANGGSAMALTEHGSMASHVKLEAAATDPGYAFGVKPIYGCEFYCAPYGSQRKFHVTAVARDAVGYRTLIKLTTVAWREFYHEPTIRKEDLFDNHRRHLCVFRMSWISSRLLHRGRKAHFLRSVRVSGMLSGPLLLTEKDLAIRSSLNARLSLSWNRRLQSSAAYERISGLLSIPIVAAMDIHYPSADDVQIQQILHNVRAGNKQTLEDQVRWLGLQVSSVSAENR